MSPDECMGDCSPIAHEGFVSSTVEQIAANMEMAEKKTK